MVFPSLGCLTCKKRRVKCDANRPSCERCRKVSRSCTWESIDDTKLRFRNENVFAQGQPRRPWTHSRKNLTKDVQESIIAKSPSPSVPIAPPISIELHAFNYWLSNYTGWQNDPHMSYEFGGYVLLHRDRAQRDSSLQSALTAFSLVLFGQARHLNEALELGDTFYTRSISKMKEEINELSSEVIDRLIVTTTLLENFDTLMYGVESHMTQTERGRKLDAIRAEFWENGYHLNATASLMQVRRQQGYPQNLLLEKGIRRLIIRNYLLRSLAVPEWLRDGTLYGEEGPTIGFDSLMIWAADFRERSSMLLRDESSDLTLHLQKVTDMTTEAAEFDQAFIAWSKSVPEDWQFSCHSFANDPYPTIPDDFLFQHSIHRYSSYGHAAMWIQYRAVRLILNSVRLQLLSDLAQCSSQESSLNAELEMCQNNISSLATDFCHSVPVFFRSMIDYSGMGCRSTSTVCLENPIDPKMAAILACPMALAVTTHVIPKAQKRWLQQRLKIIANVIGAAQLHATADKEDVAA